jgi:hypothetical protein
MEQRNQTVQRTGLRLAELERLDGKKIMRQIVPLVSLLIWFVGMTGTLAFADSPPDTPSAVVQSFVTKLVAIAPKYPELSGFPKYAANREDKLRIHFEQGLKPIKTKSGVQPGDFEGQGLFLIFEVADDSLGGQPTATATTRHLAALHLSLYADFHLSSSPSAGLSGELKKLIADHVAMLEQLNERAANKTVEPMPTR